MHNNLLRRIKQNFNYLDATFLTILHKTYVRSHCIQAWSQFLLKDETIIKYAENINKNGPLT